LDKDLVVNGALDHVEIWDPAIWAEYEKEQDPQFDKLNKLAWV
jgi:DNA-binding transcriptional regulator/RsmH inhibitor MraZ